MMRSFLLFIVIALCGCQIFSPDHSPLSSEDQTIVNAVDSLFSAYQEYTYQRFADHLAEEYRPSRRAFLNEADENRSREKVLDVQFFIDETVQKGATSAVTLRWQKKIQPYSSGTSAIVEGKATFIFIQTKADEYKLESIRGDNPFV